MSAKEPLDVLAGQIKAKVKKGDEMMLSAALLVTEAKERVDNGEAGGDWEKWRLENIPDVSVNWTNTLIRIGKADDPYKALLEYRANAADRKRKSRQKKAEQKKSTETQSEGCCDVTTEAQLEEWVATYLDMPRGLQDEGLHRINAMRIEE